MAQHDYVIDNQAFPATRADLNSVLQAIVSNNSGSSAPSTTFANQIWYDSSANILYIRNEDNDANIPLLQLDQSGDVAATLATIIDVLDKSGTNQSGQDLTIRAGAGTGSGAGGNIVLQTANAGSSGSSVNSHATAVTIDDAGNLGVGETAPAGQIHIKGSDATNQVIIENTDAGSGVAPDLTLRRTSASPADGDGIGEVIFQCLNDNSENLTMADIRGFVTDVSDGTEDGAITFRTREAGSLGERMRIDGSNVGIGVTPVRQLHVNAGSENVYLHLTNAGTGTTTTDGLSILVKNSNSEANIIQREAAALTFSTSATERMRILSDGKVLVSKTASNTATAGIELRDNGQIVATLDGGGAAVLNRLSSDGNIIKFLQDGATDGQINVISGDIAIGTGDTGFRFGTSAILPHNLTTNALRDNAIDLGSGSYRYDDIFATNGTIQTSDQNEKQQIASLTDTEITAAKAISKLFKTFKWNDSVEAKGDNARKHTGHIAQEVQQAMTDAGLDATKYAFFCSDTWWETQTDVPAVEAVEEVAETIVNEDGSKSISIVTEAVEAQDAYTRVDAYYTADDAPKGATERTRLGIRYPELLAFIGAATEQRLTSIEARLTALEG